MKFVQIIGRSMAFRREDGVVLGLKNQRHLRLILVDGSLCLLSPNELPISIGSEYLLGTVGYNFALSEMLHCLSIGLLSLLPGLINSQI